MSEINVSAGCEDAFDEVGARRRALRLIRSLLVVGVHLPALARSIDQKPVVVDAHDVAASRVVAVAFDLRLARRPLADRARCSIRRRRGQLISLGSALNASLLVSLSQGAVCKLLAGGRRERCFLLIGLIALGRVHLLLTIELLTAGGNRLLIVVLA